MTCVDLASQLMEPQMGTHPSGEKTQLYRDPFIIGLMQSPNKMNTITTEEYN